MTSNAWTQQSVPKILSRIAYKPLQDHAPGSSPLPFADAYRQRNGQHTEVVKSLTRVFSKCYTLLHE